MRPAAPALLAAALLGAAAASAAETHGVRIAADCRTLHVDLKPTG